MASYFLTRRAFIELEDIYQYSIKHWGERVARTYMKDLYDAFQLAADRPEIGKHRQYRSFPYFMAPAAKHYIVYEPVGGDIIIASVIHSKRDIESLVKKLGSELSDEILLIRKKLEERA